MSGRLQLALALSLALAPAALRCAAQAPGVTAPPQAPGVDLDARLDEELASSAGNPSEIMAVLEHHLQVHTDCPKRKEILTVIGRLAIEAKDHRRLMEYGPLAIEGGSRDPRLLQNVTRDLLDRDDDASKAKALKYAGLLADAMRAERQSQLAVKTYSPGQGRRLEETEFALSLALVYQARAMDQLGYNEDALKSAVEAWELEPGMESALERARVLERLGRFSEALDAAAEAFVVEDERGDAHLRQRARERMAELAEKGGVADASSRVLPAWDRTRPLIETRRLRFRAFDPNSVAASPLEFSLTRLDGGRMPLNTLKGKVVVLDFWATWCGPCRAQHPLYEQVKARFKGNPDVVFLAIATDEDRSLVKPFLERQKWSNEVLYDDGIGGYFRVSSIPTTVVLNRRGEVASRMPGYIPERFVDMLTDRIKTALEQN